MQRPRLEWACQTGAVCPAHVLAKLELGEAAQLAQVHTICWINCTSYVSCLGQVHLSLTFFLFFG